MWTQGDGTGPGPKCWPLPTQPAPWVAPLEHARQRTQTFMLLTATKPGNVLHRYPSMVPIPHKDTATDTHRHTYTHTSHIQTQLQIHTGTHTHTSHIQTQLQIHTGTHTHTHPTYRYRCRYTKAHTCFFVSLYRRTSSQRTLTSKTNLEETIMQPRVP